MEARELRIGNLVFIDGNNIVLGVYLSDEKYPIILIKKVSYIGQHGIEDIKPIPITEEWLKRFGLLNNDLGIWNNGDAVYFDYGFEHSIEIKYVHQLQNLYFDLTGQEL